MAAGGHHKVQNEVSTHLGDAKEAKHEIVSYATQVVAGTNFLVKVKISGDKAKERHAHVKIFRDLKNNVKLTSVADNKTADDPL